MQQDSIMIKVPGKLMIAGEFAVLEPYQISAVLAVDRFVYTKIEAAEHDMVTLQDFYLEHIGVTREKNRMIIHTEDKRKHFVENAMTTAYKYLMELGLPIEPFHLSIRSELDDPSGVKYGLGSSAAIVTSVISALLTKFLPNKPDKEIIFKLAAISHVQTQGNGSGADVAASTYGGFLKYASFQGEWLLQELRATTSLVELVHKQWKYLTIEPIALPKGIYFSVGWTGKPASTAKLVDQVMGLKEEEIDQYNDFLDKSRLAVEKFFKGMKEQNFPLLLEGVRENRQALLEVGHQTNTPIETPLLSTLSDIAESLGGAGKSSGAGGGDCGIAFMSSQEKREKLTVEWEKRGIIPLTLQPDLQGAVQI